jgi:hypothetical protein
MFLEKRSPSIISIPIEIKINQDLINSNRNTNTNNNSFKTYSDGKRIVLECSIEPKPELSSSSQNRGKPPFSSMSMYSPSTTMRSTNNSASASTVKFDLNLNKNNLKSNTTSSQTRIINLAKSDTLAQQVTSRKPSELFIPDFGQRCCESSLKWNLNPGQNEYTRYRSPQNKLEQNENNRSRKKFQHNNNNEYLEKIPENKNTTNLSSNRIRPSEYANADYKPTRSCVHNFGIKYKSPKSIVLLKTTPTPQVCLDEKGRLNHDNKASQQSDFPREACSKLPIKSGENKQGNDIVVQIFRDLLYLYRLDKQQMNKFS